MTIWKDIFGFEGLYKISDCGQVKSLSYYGGKRQKILKLRPDKNGYLIVGLWKNRKRYTMKVHRIVAQTFIPNPDNFPQVNHKDGNPANNHVDNLEWCTAKYNCNYGEHSIKAAKAQLGKKHTMEHIMKIRENSPNRKPVVMVEKESMKVLAEFPSSCEAARQINGTATNITQACKKPHRTYRGYYWRYKSEIEN